MFCFTEMVHDGRFPRKIFSTHCLKHFQAIVFHFDRGFAKVYYARNRGTADKAPRVAVKSMDLNQHIHYLKSIMVEVNALRSLDHPNIIKLLGENLWE